MMDFVSVEVKTGKNGVIEVEPEFLTTGYSDLMIAGKDFYAIWDEDKKLWSKNEIDAIKLIDKSVAEKVKELKAAGGGDAIRGIYMKKFSTGKMTEWKKYLNTSPDSYIELDEKVIFADTDVKREDYASKRLPYSLSNSKCPAYEELMSVLYDEDNRRKIEWAIGSIFTGDSKTIQKFLVLYGPPGTGKSTILNIIQMLFEGYWTVFDAKDLAKDKNFSMSAFVNHPLVAIQADGDLSKIEDNTKLNGIVSHEIIQIETKYHSPYPSRINTFLFMGTNKPVKITDSMSGIIRRLIDVKPTGNKVPYKRYDTLTKAVKFELGAIAQHCINVYSEMGIDYYDSYKPETMMEATNPFYNFMDENRVIFTRQDSTTLKAAWDLYKDYCKEALVPYPMTKMSVKQELKSYFESYISEGRDSNGTHVYSYYKGFKIDKFKNKPKTKQKESTWSPSVWLKLTEQESIFDKTFMNCKAQLAKKDGTPKRKWENVNTALKDIPTNELHYVLIPEEMHHIFVDFDIHDESGNKSFKLNAEAASAFPKTYAELSKSGEGIHLHYFYDGDLKALSSIFAPNIEIKVSVGLSPVRRKLSKCNNLPIATINSGLPLKGVTKVIDFKGFKDEEHLINSIKRNLRKENEPHATKPSIDYIFNDLENAYNSGMQYDVTNLSPDIYAFAMQSTHNKDYCLKKFAEMKFRSDPVIEEPVEYGDDDIIFYDVESYPEGPDEKTGKPLPSYFCACWKALNSNGPVTKWINPSPEQMEWLLRQKLGGFNCKRYDNHMIYAKAHGETNQQLNKRSYLMINGKTAKERAAGYCQGASKASYIDVWDVATNKQSLKAWEIELGITHKEMNIPWDKPAPLELYNEIADYCANDVLATIEVYKHIQADIQAREILSAIAGTSMNESTNNITTKIIFGDNKNPQNEFRLRDLSKPVLDPDDDLKAWLNLGDEPEFVAWNGEKSYIPFFPGYEFKNGVSTYRGFVVGEGGFVYSKPGAYRNAKTLDVAGEHPTSAIQEMIFGPRYTQKYKEIVDTRVHIKHKDFETPRHMLGGIMAPYLEDESKAKGLAKALKLAVNSVYGLTSAKFENPFADLERNKDNKVAKRGALFMIDLLFACLQRGYEVIHIKTDSIKIAGITEEAERFVINFGKKYGYRFETEHEFDRICLVNDAVYIAYCGPSDPEIPNQWSATGTQFAVPFVFKSLFSHEGIEHKDLCETKSVKTSIYLDMNEKLPDVSKEESMLKKLQTKLKKGKATPEEIELINTLPDEIAKGHDYIFVGRVGAFTPILPGNGGGLLMRSQDKSYSAVTGTKGYRWMESELVNSLNLWDKVDLSYYAKLADEAKEAINKYIPYEEFVSVEHD